MEGQIDSLKKDLEQNLDTVDNRLKDLSENVADIAKSSNANRGTATEATGKIEELENIVNKKFEEIDKKLEEVKELNGRVEFEEDKIENIEQRLAKIEQKEQDGDKPDSE
jgi:DNA repair ATPase RecN